METKETIERIVDHFRVHDDGRPTPKLDEAVNMAIEALEMQGKNKTEQQVAAEILTQFMFVRNMEDVVRVWDDVYEKYGLCEDPFTHIPCTREEYYKNKLEYDRQVMTRRYGHCDGLD